MAQRQQAMTQAEPQEPDYRLGKALPAGPLDQLWEQKAIELQVEALPQARKSAERWAATVSAVIGAASLAAVVKRPEDVSTLTGWGQSAVAAALLVAVIAAVTAVISAATAAQESLTRLRPFTGDVLRQWSEEEVQKVKGRLLLSRVASVAAVIALVAAAAVTWFGPRQPTAGTFRVIESSGTTYCGTPLESHQGALRLKTGAVVHSIPLNAITLVTPATC